MSCAGASGCFFVRWFVRAHCEASCSGYYTRREVSIPGEVNGMGAAFLVVGIGLVIVGGVVARRHFRAGLTVALIGGALLLAVIFG